jgi:membrane-associated phospholipid phosphatase
MERIPPGEVAWYVTGRFYAAAEGGALLDAGYFLHLQGVEGDLFSGAPGEGTAYLTFLADPFTATNIVNGDITLGMDAVGDFAVYLNREPGATFSDPASFGAGEEVARFRRVAVVTGASVGTGAEDRPLFSLNVFSARLVSCREFELGGRRYDFGRLMPNGITQWGTAASTAIAEALPGYSAVIPFVGSAIAIGGRTDAV